MILDDDLTEDELAEWAKHGSSEEKRAVALHPNASLNTLLELARDGFHDEVDQNPLLLLHVETGSYKAGMILEEIAKKITRRERLEELSTSLFLDVRSAVSSNKSTPSSALKILSKDENWGVRRNVAEHENSDLETILSLVDDPDQYVRAGVCCNEKTPVSVLDSMSKKDNRPIVLMRISYNKNTSLKVLGRLAFNEDSNVRSGVARNPNVSEKILVVLSADDDSRVRLNVARNEKTPVAILAKLCIDPEWEVRKGVAENKNVTSEMICSMSQDKDNFVCLYISGMKNAPIEALSNLSRNKAANVRCKVAKNPNTPVHILEKLSKEYWWDVRICVAENLNTPIEAMMELARDEDGRVRRTAKETLTKISSSSATLDLLAKDEEEIVRSAAKEALAKLQEAAR